MASIAFTRQEVAVCSSGVGVKIAEYLNVLLYICRTSKKVTLKSKIAY